MSIVRYTKSRYVEEVGMFREEFPAGWFREICKLYKPEIIKGTEEFKKFREILRRTYYGDKHPTGVNDIKNINLLREYHAGLTGSDYEPLPKYVCTY